MSTMPARGQRVRRPLSLVLGAALAGALAVGAPLTPRQATVGPTDGGDQRLAAAHPSYDPTSFVMSSLNLLGAGHTDGKNPRSGFAKSGKRLKWSMRALLEENVEIVGFQEMHRAQATKFNKSFGDDWGVFPGTRLSERAGHNSISWRKSRWAEVSTRTEMIPYFHNNPFPMPYVLLRNRGTGQKVWVVNVHNPADAHGNAQKYRDAAVAKEVALVNRLRRADPTIPVFLTGDMNDHEKFFCPLVSGTRLASASGGSANSKSCTPPPVMKVDWLLGSRDLNTFTSYLVRRDDLVAKATDHPLIAARVTIPSLAMRKKQIKHVVVLAVDGLRSRTVRQLGRDQLPQIHKMIRTGASTLNARTTAGSTLALPNLVSMLTGVSVDPESSGHGISLDIDPDLTIAQTAGRYVPSVFDKVHDDGRRTSLFSSDPDVDVVVRSWSATTGALDRLWTDNGRGKISDTSELGHTEQAVGGLLAALRTRPGALSIAQLDAPARAGRTAGFASTSYKREVIKTDKLIGKVLRTVRRDPELAAHTVVLLAGTSGGTGHGNASQTRKNNYIVPLLATGKGVPAGTDLYRLNRGWHDPGKRARAGGAPISVDIVANLALALLQLPAISGSTANAHQRFDVLR